MSKIEDLKKEEAVLEEKMYGNQSDDPADAAPLTGDPTVPEGNVEPPEAKKQRTSWKKRYTSYKTTTDHTLHSLRQENAALKASMANANESTDTLKQEIQEIKRNIASTVDPYDGIITQEDTDIIGSEAVEIMKKVANHNKANPDVDDLRKELNALKAENNRKLKAEAEVAKANSFSTLKDKLSTVVPDWKVLDEEDGFREFMEGGYDKYSGVPRMDLFSSAMRSGDVANIARFYNEYKSSKPETKESILENRVTPVAEGAGDTLDGNQRQKKTYSIREHTEFYNSLNRGEWKGREKQARELQHILDTAFVEGRLTN